MIRIFLLHSGQLILASSVFSKLSGAMPPGRYKMLKNVGSCSTSLAFKSVLSEFSRIYMTAISMSGNPKVQLNGWRLIM